MLHSVTLPMRELKFITVCRSFMTWNRSDLKGVSILVTFFLLCHPIVKWKKTYVRGLGQMMNGYQFLSLSQVT